MQDNGTLHHCCSHPANIEYLFKRHGFHIETVLFDFL